MLYRIAGGDYNYMQADYREIVLSAIVLIIIGIVLCVNFNGKNGGERE